MSKTQDSTCRYFTLRGTVRAEGGQAAGIVLASPDGELEPVGELGARFVEDGVFQIHVTVVRIDAALDDEQWN